MTKKFNIFYCLNANKANKIHFLNITTSVITVIRLTNKIISLCQGHIVTIKDVSSDLQIIIVAGRSLKFLVASLEFLLSTWDTSNMLQSLEGPKRPLEATKKVFVTLKKLFLSIMDHNVTKAKCKVVIIFYAKLAWPFKEKKARKILNDIAHYKVSILLALTTDTADVITFFFHHLVFILANSSIKKMISRISKQL